MMKKNLRNQPFPDSILRDMAIRFPTGERRADEAVICEVF